MNLAADLQITLWAAAAGIILLATGCNSWETGNRILFENASVNHRRVSLALDTGSSDSALFDEEAHRLKIHSKQADVALEINQHSVDLSMLVLSFPDWGIDGFIGWPSVQDNILWFDPVCRCVARLETLPLDIKTWTHWRIIPDSVLVVEVPDSAGKPAAVLIDTGFRDGVLLAPSARKEWKSKRQAVQVGSIELHDITVEHMNSGLASLLQAMRPGIPTALGMAALNQLEMIVDARSGYIHVRPVSNANAGLAKWTVLPNVKIISRTNKK